MVMSLILLAPSWGGMINGMMTLSGAWHKLRDDPILRFLVVSLAFYGIRIGIAVDLGLGVGDHIQQCLGDGQVIALVAQVVVTAVQCQVALVDAIHTHVLASACMACKRSTVRSRLAPPNCREYAVGFADSYEGFVPFV